MEFLVVNRRCPSREMPFRLGAKKDGCFHKLHVALRLLGKNSKVSFVSQFPKETLNTKQTTPNVEVCPESLGVMLEY